MELKKSEEVLAEIYRNSQLALQSISNILPETEDTDLREELLKEHEEYEKIGGKAAILAKDRDIELKNPNPMKKAMMWSKENADEEIKALAEELLAMEEEFEKKWKEFI